jgi:exopolyphosphatase/guanosine-5'-triphosphate,3'-diphosphate pyrophosphatase
MKIAVIDCGSNTFNLLIAEADQEGWKPIFKNKLPVKLGAGGYQSKEIKEDRFNRGIDALVAHAANLRNFACERVYAYATSAIRDARNGEEFVTKAQSLTGIQIHVIDGEREADLIFKGILNTLEASEKSFLVMDIGGGSTEFIIGNAKGIQWKHSFKLGVSRIHDWLQPSDPMTKEDIARVESHLQLELQPLADALKKYETDTLIGSSGSFDTLLELYLHGQGLSTSNIGLSNEILISAFPVIYDWIINSTFKQRLVHPVIPSIRAEYMPLSVILMKYVLGMLDFKKFMHSSYSLKEGAMNEIIENIEWPDQIDAHNEKPEDYLEG